MPRKRIKPATEAEYFVSQKTDRPGLESVFIDEYTGMSAYCTAGNRL